MNRNILHLLNYLKEIILILVGIGIVLYDFPLNHYRYDIMLSLGIIIVLFVSLLNKVCSYEKEKLLFHKNIYNILIITVIIKMLFFGVSLIS